ncbi:MAG: glucose-1-phosphate adenylyltransferase [Candidatus Dormibacteraeota bacterium]|uniref:Glucose-1-phosphate adenylyltransferase n=1 Tax=Candidatus Dormiibacter inghamiae TaxID=3127013 RepID=A0A934KHM4_9BACT|nr:glucose-1-phosphate adenylyltransferase [Candidatus Dormibacteraeota bacterium]MBJ7606650.1 glucose-1-phosphate adenylyltransferase [Candidatus Dormibacteraeota bacterium]
MTQLAGLGRDELHVMAMVLAGGQGTRLLPLTLDRAKPAVPFGGTYRLIDFVLSNLVNSGLRKIVVLTQYKSHSLDRHIAQMWRLSPMLGNYVANVPAQMRLGPRWFLGSADAVFQNLNLINDEKPEYICVFGADHIYRMDAMGMLRHHIQSGAGITLAGIPVPVGEASAFGIIEGDEEGHVRSFVEKPHTPKPLPHDPSRAYASMGIYIFTTSALVEAVSRDSSDDGSRHDLGGSIVPMLVDQGQAGVYDFNTNRVPGVSGREAGYWRDVGDLDSYYQASMDLLALEPPFNLYNQEWPIYSWLPPVPPAKFVHDEDGRRGMALNSLVSSGVIVSGGQVRRSILSPGVVVHSHAEVEGCVLMDGVDVGGGAKLRNAVIDKGVRIPAGATVGYDLAADRERLHVTPGGIVAIGKGQSLGALPA